MKLCKTCCTEKPLEEYHKHKAKKDGLFSECKECHRTRQREWARLNKERHASFFKRWLENNPEKNASRVKSYKMKKIGQMSDLAKTPLVKEITEQFYWFSSFLTEHTGKPHDVDHIIPISKGGDHAPWNLQVLTASANRRKGAKIEVQV